MKRQIRFSKKTLDALPPCPVDARTKESEYSDTEVAGLRIQVNRLGRKRFLLRYTFAGAKRSMKLGDYPLIDATQARQKALECRSQLARGIDPQVELRAEQQAALTLRAFVEQYYLPHAYATKRSAKADESRLRLHILPEFGEQALNTISSYSLQEFHNRKKAQLCPASANRMLEIIKRVYSLAIIWEQLDKNPAKGIRLHQENNRRQRYLSHDELRRFLAALDSEHNRSAADAFRFLLATGTRREETLQARWEHVDLEQRRLFLPHTKSGKSRHVYLNDTALAILLQRPHIPGNPFVFAGKLPGQGINNPSRAFKRVLERAQIKGFRLHDLRHSAASLAINSGASLYEVQHLLGHASGSTTTARYAHLSNDRMNQVSNQIAHILQAASASKKE